MLTDYSDSITFISAEFVNRKKQMCCLIFIFAGLVDRKWKWIYAVPFEKKKKALAPTLNNLKIK